MTIKELERKIIEEELDKQVSVSLHGDLIPDTIVLFHKDVTWDILYFDEKGNKELLKKYETEDEACEFIYKELIRYKKHYGYM